MDIRQQCLYCLNLKSYISAYITNLSRDHKKWMLYIVATQLPADGVAIEYDSIQLPLVREPHPRCYPYTPEDRSSDTEAECKNPCIDPEQPPSWTRIDGTPQLDNHQAVQHISSEYFDIFENEIDLWSAFSFLEEYQSAHWFLKLNLSRAAI